MKKPQLNLVAPPPPAASGLRPGYGQGTWTNKPWPKPTRAKDFISDMLVFAGILTIILTTAAHTLHSLTPKTQEITMNNPEPEPSSSRRPLTDAQSEILEFVRMTIKTLRSPPTLREIAEAIGVTPSAVGDHLNRIRAKGYITWEPGKARTLRLL